MEVLNSNMTFKKDNGHFLIDGVEYMTVETYNSFFDCDICPKRLRVYASNTGASFIDIIPDATTVYRTVKAYPIEVINKHASRYNN